MTSTTHRRTIYRAKGLLASGIRVNGALMVIGLLVLVLSRHAQVLGVLLLVIGIVMMWRGYNLEVHIRSDGVKVQHWIGSHTLSWDEIDRFDVSPFEKYPYVGHVILKNGKEVISLGLSTPHKKNASYVQVPVAELNALLDERRHAHA